MKRVDKKARFMLEHYHASSILYLKKRKTLIR